MIAYRALYYCCIAIANSESDHSRLGRASSKFGHFRSAVPLKATLKGPSSTVHGVVFEILCPGRWAHRRNRTRTHVSIRRHRGSAFAERVLLAIDRKLAVV
jgi:hypothetical protein